MYLSSRSVVTYGVPFRTQIYMQCVSAKNAYPEEGVFSSFLFHES